MRRTAFRRPASLLVVLFFFFCLSPCSFASPEPSLKINAYPEFLYGIPPGLDLDSLIDKPMLVDFDYYVFKDSVTGEKRLSGFAEVVAVYAFAMQDLLDVSLDFESYPSFVPRIFATTILSREGQQYRLKYNAGIKFLGISVTYDSIFDSVLETLPDGGLGLRSALVNSLDDASYEHFTSFYFCPVTVQGKTMTFVRYFNRPGIKRPSVGMLQLLNLFTPSAARGQVAAIAKETEKRSGRR